MDNEVTAILDASCRRPLYACKCVSDFTNARALWDRHAAYRIVESLNKWKWDTLKSIAWILKLFFAVSKWRNFRIGPFSGQPQCDWQSSWSHMFWVFFYFGLSSRGNTSHVCFDCGLRKTKTKSKPRSHSSIRLFSFCSMFILFILSQQQKTITIGVRLLSFSMYSCIDSMLQFSQTHRNAIDRFSNILLKSNHFYQLLFVSVWCLCISRRLATGIKDQILYHNSIIIGHNQ